MSVAWHCDGPDCDTWQKIGSTMSFIEINEINPDGQSTFHFCKWDCVLKFSAGIEPTMSFEL